MRYALLVFALFSLILGSLALSTTVNAFGASGSLGFSAANLDAPKPKPTRTSSPTRTRTNTPTVTRMATPTQTASNTATPTVTPTATDTPTPSLTPTPSFTPTASDTPTPSFTPSPTNTPTQTSTPNSGNSFVLSDAAQTFPAYGNGFVVMGNGTYQRMTSSSDGTDSVGYADGNTYRAYIEWDTTSLPKNLALQSVALYLHIVTSYGSGNTVNLVKLANPVSSYPDNPSGNQQLFQDLGSAPIYSSGSTVFQSTGNNLLALAPTQPPNTVLADLQDAIANSRPFAVGLIGSNEASAFTSFLAKQDTTLPDHHPALVITANGLDGFNQPPLRPLRTGFWDGTNYWQFVMGDQGQYYYSSPDAVHWTLSGQLSPSPNRHFSVWYLGNGTVYAVYSQKLPDPYPQSNDLDFVMGTINGTSITWTAPNTIFKSNATPNLSDGYMSPSLAVDTNGFCYALAMHYAGGASGIEVKRSTDATCTAWSGTAVLLAQSSRGNERDRGGYVVPLTNGKMYAVYKDTNGTTGQLYGQLYDGKLEPRETLDSSAALGVYEEGMSIVTSGDTAYLAYIHGDGSLRFAIRKSAWGPSAVVDASYKFYSPSLTLETGTGNLFLFYRTSSTYDVADGQVFDQTGISTDGQISWLGRSLLVSSSWSPVLDWQPDYSYSLALWPMVSNYSADRKVFVTYVDGAFGIVTLPFLK